MVNFINKNWRKLILTACAFAVPVISFAEEGEGKIIDPLGERFGTVSELIKTILEGVIRIGLPVIALAIVFSGFLFVFARGNPEKLTKARDALLYTIVGAAILLGAWAIAKMIKATVFSL